MVSSAEGCREALLVRCIGPGSAPTLRCRHVRHAGLHHIADETPVGKSWKPIYHLNKEDNLTGTPRQTLPKGSWWNPSQVMASLLSPVLTTALNVHHAHLKHVLVA